MLGVLLEAAVRSLILAVLVWAALSVLRVRNPLARLFVWTGVLLAAIAMPLLVLGGQELTQILPTWVAAPMQVVVVVPVGLTHSVTSARSALPDWGFWAAVVYPVVATIFLLRVITGFVRGWALRARATPAPRAQSKQAVRISCELTSPMVFGFTILLPADSVGWSAEKRAAVLAHESSHVARGDFYVQMLACMHRAVFWFSPLGWWLPRALATHAEAASDDAAANVLDDRVSYAEVLMEVARGARPAPAGVAMARGPAVTDRIRRLLAGVDLCTPLNPVQRVFVVLALLPATLIAAGAAARAPENKEVAQTPSRSLLEKVADQVVWVTLPPLTEETRRIASAEEPPTFSLPKPSFVDLPAWIPERKEVVTVPGGHSPPIVPVAYTDHSNDAVEEVASHLVHAANFLPLPTLPEIVVTATNIVLPRTNPSRPIAMSYPSEALEVPRNRCGTVILMATVEADGSVSKAVVDESSGNRTLDDSARSEAVRTWRLLPGTVDGRAAAMEQRFKVTFRVDGGRSSSDCRNTVTVQNGI